jgi:E3 ubiquitin-protein ligase HECTD1
LIDLLEFGKYNFIYFQVIIALLQNGANPDLRDEDGRTALEKARERSDESHQQVIQILESPSDYMMLAKKKRTDQRETADELMETCGEKNEEDDEDDEQDQATAIDPATTRQVIQQLIPIFCVVFNVSFFYLNE